MKSWEVKNNFPEKRNLVKTTNVNHMVEESIHLCAKYLTEKVKRKTCWDVGTRNSSLFLFIYIKASTKVHHEDRRKHMYGHNKARFKSDVI